MTLRRHGFIAGAIFLGSVSAAAGAQTATEPGAGYVTEQRGDEVPWGLLGLLGLAGLLGLKKKDETVRRDEHMSRNR